MSLLRGTISFIRFLWLRFGFPRKIVSLLRGTISFIRFLWLRFGFPRKIVSLLRGTISFIRFLWLRFGFPRKIVSLLRGTISFIRFLWLRFGFDLIGPWPALGDLDLFRALPFYSPFFSSLYKRRERNGKAEAFKRSAWIPVQPHGGSSLPPLFPQGDLQVKRC